MTLHMADNYKRNYYFIYNIIDYVDENFFYNAVYNAASGLLKFYNRKGQEISSVKIN